MTSQAPGRWRWARASALVGLVAMLGASMLGAERTHASVPAVPPPPVSPAVASATFPPAFSDVNAPQPSRLDGTEALDAPETEPVPDFSEIDQLMEGAVRGGRTPGAVVLVGRQSGALFRRAYGRRAIVPERQAMTPDTIFDLASLTKPLVVGTLVHWLVEAGRLRLDDRVSAHLPEFGARGKADVSVQQLLLHTSGLPPTNPLREYRDGPQRSRALALGAWLAQPPERRFMYSDVGYIALGAMIESITGEPLDVTAERVIWEPLGMADTQFCRSRCSNPRVAPTELAYGWKTSPIRGEVQDPRAYRLGGVAGNAGLFSTADDLGRYARMLLSGGVIDGTRVLSSASVAAFTSAHPVPRGLRALGWDVSTEFSGPRGHQLSERAYGHGGYTGTALWIDPVLDLFVLFLSNRNHPFGTGKVLDLQGAVADAAVRALREASVPPSSRLASGPTAPSSHLERHVSALD